MLNNSENDRLFAKSVPISLKNVLSDQTRTCNLFLTIEWRQDASAGMYSKKVLSLSLTDENDPFFLFNLDLTEEDFETLKTNQGLLINFSAFPQQIIEFIEKCLFAEKNPLSKLSLVFTIKEKFGNTASFSQFEIIETNQFKHTTHLTLTFVSATESEIRKYIASCFGVIKENRKQLERGLACSEQDKNDRLTSMQHALRKTEQELETLKRESCAELEARDKKHEQQLKEEKNRWTRRLKEEQSRFEKEKKEKEHNYEKEIHKLEQREKALDKMNKEIQDKNYNLESTIGNLRSKILSLEDEIKQLKNNIKDFQQKCDDFNRKLKDKDIHINEQAAVINNLQLDIENKSQSIKKLTQKIEYGARDKRTREDEIENLEIHLDVHKKTIKELEKDKNEGNRIIVELQEKLKTAKSKIEHAEKYKNTISEKDKLLQSMQKEKADLVLLLDEKNSEIKYVRDTMNFHLKKIIDLEGKLKHHISVGLFLRSQLDEHGIVPSHLHLLHDSPTTDNLTTSPLSTNPLTTSPLTTFPSAVAQERLAEINRLVGEHSPSLDNYPSVIPSNKATSKSVRIETTSSPVLQEYKDTPQRLQKTNATDSGFVSKASTSANKTPKVHTSNKKDSNNKDLKDDPEAIKAAFENTDHGHIKHSTAKKTPAPRKSTTRKVLKR